MYEVKVIDKHGNIVTTLDATEYAEVGAVFIGSGLARRTFVFQGTSHTMEYKFVEVETADIDLSRPDGEEMVEGLVLPTPVITVQLPQGSQIRVELADTDGGFTISYDYKGNKKLYVEAHISGNVLGDEGIIYMEDFSKTEHAYAEEKVEVRPNKITCEQNMVGGCLTHGDCDIGADGECAAQR